MNHGHGPDDEDWEDRLVEDARRLDDLLSREDREVVRGAVALADAQGCLDFLVVYGSVARGERRADSDLDIYFEASDLLQAFNRTDAHGRWHVFGLPSGALLENLRAGRELAFELIDTALIVTDRGPFRALLDVVAAEDLGPVVG